MVNRLIQLLIIVVIVALIGWFLDWVMMKLAVAAMIQTVVWIVFGLIAFLALLGLLGYGPLSDKMGNSPPA